MSGNFNYAEHNFPALDHNNRQRATPKWKLYSQNSRSETQEFGNEKSPNITEKDVLRGPSQIKYGSSFQINIQDAISVTASKLSIKDKPNVKRFLKTEQLYGNPLDTDQPPRQKGVVNLHKKRKSLSNTKKKVLARRKEIEEANKFASNIILDGDIVRFSSEVPRELLWQSVSLSHSSKVKEILKKSTQNIIYDAKTQSKDGVSSKHDEDNLENSIFLKHVLSFSGEPVYKFALHSHNFKRYCDNCITKELNNVTEALIAQIVRFQMNKYQKNPIKAMADKRYVLGMKQTKKFLKLNKIKLIVCVPDMEDGMYNFVEELKSLASAYCIPYLFAFSRQKLGFLTYKRIGVCCFGLLDYSGAEEKFNKTLEAATIARNQYKEKLASLMKENPTLNVSITLDKCDMGNVIDDLRNKCTITNRYADDLMTHRERNS